MRLGRRFALWEPPALKDTEEGSEKFPREFFERLWNFSG